MMNRILDALRSPGAMMIALMLALLAQGEHTAQVFAFFSHSNGGNAQALAYAFAAAVEVAVLLFVLRGHKHISYAFAVATLCTNIVYYAIGGIDLLSVAIAPVLLLSALLPGVIVGYSHTIAEAPKSNTTPDATPATASRRRWQFWRNPQDAHQKAAVLTKNDKASIDITRSEIKPRSATPEVTTKALEVEVPPVKEATQAETEPQKQPQPATPKPAPVLRKVDGATDTELAAQLGVTRQAVAGMRKRGTLDKRIAEMLPDLAPIHVNGNSKQGQL